MVRDYVESQNDAVELEFLPAYAPELNPVEYLWVRIPVIVNGETVRS